MTHLVTRNVRPIPILTYHQIASKPTKGTPFRSLCVAPNDFALQMGVLKLLGYQGLSMTDLMPYLCGQKQGRVVGITFDDGYQNNLLHALPVLAKHQFSSTCYIVSQRIGGCNTWDEEIGIPQVPLMTNEELLQWIDAGQELGAHTRTHVHLSKADNAALESEVHGCKLDLEALVGRDMVHFCYPYGDYNERVTQSVRASAYLSATTTMRGRCQAGQSLYTLPRVPVVRATSLAAFVWKLVSTYEDRRGPVPY